MPADPQNILNLGNYNRNNYENIPGFYYYQLPAEVLAAQSTSVNLYNNLRDDYLSTLNYNPTDTTFYDTGGGYNPLREYPIQTTGFSDLGAGVKVYYDDKNTLSGDDNRPAVSNAYVVPGQAINASIGLPLPLGGYSGLYSPEKRFASSNPGNFNGSNYTAPPRVLSDLPRLPGQPDQTWSNYYDSWAEAVNAFADRYTNFADSGVLNGYAQIGNQLGGIRTYGSSFQDTGPYDNDPWNSGEAGNWLPSTDTFGQSGWNQMADYAQIGADRYSGGNLDDAKKTARVTLARLGQLGTPIERNLMSSLAEKTPEVLEAEHVRKTLDGYADILDTQALDYHAQLQQDISRILTGSSPVNVDGPHGFNGQLKPGPTQDINYALDVALNADATLGTVFQDIINSFTRRANSKIGAGGSGFTGGSGVTAYTGDLIAPGNVQQRLPKDQEFQSVFNGGASGGGYSGKVG